MEVAGGAGGADPDGHRALELGHGGAHGLVEIEVGLQAPADHGGDDLGVGGDLGGDRELLGRDQIGEVVDVAVEYRGDVGAGVGWAAVGGLVTVDGVGVGLGDDADRGPAGVGQDRGFGLVGGEGQLEQLVGHDGVAHGVGVVAQLPDLGRRLVDEADLTLGGADRAALEQGVGGAGGQEGGHPLGAEVEAVVADQYVETGRIAAPDLKADRGWRGPAGWRRRRRPRPGSGRPLPAGPPPPPPGADRGPATRRRPSAGRGRR